MIERARRPSRYSAAQLGRLVDVRASVLATEILTRDQLLDLSRMHSTEVYDRSIDVQILRLRRKIEPDSSHPTFIRTERGVGYYFDAPVKVMR